MIEIFVNSRSYRIYRSSLSGAEIRALDLVESRYEVCLERDEPPLYQFIRDDEMVTITPGQRFLTIPPSSYGRAS